MNTRRLGMVGLVALGLVACGSDDTQTKSNNSGAAQGTFNATTAKAAGTQISTAVSQILAGKGTEGAMALAGVGQAAMGLVTPGGGAATQGFQGIGEASQADTSGTCDCVPDGKSCTFKGCTSASGASSWTMDGTISWDGGKVVCDLTFTGKSTGYDLDFHEVCDLAVTATSLDGSFKTNGSATVAAQGQNVATTWDVSETFAGVKFPEGGGCPSAGTIEATATFSAGGQSFSGSGSVTFDGTCQ